MTTNGVLIFTMGFLFLFLGYMGVPVAFALIASVMIVTIFTPVSQASMIAQLFNGMDVEALLAGPLFLLVGEIMAAANGTLNLSVLDGWWAEAYDGANGFAIGGGTSHVSDEITDRRDSESLHDVLSKTVIPTFYDRDVDGLPRTWIKMMMNSISSLAWRFSSHRMVMDYARACYVPAAGGLSCDMRA